MRIVSLLPSATEILFAIGAGEDVVGVTFECDWPPEARSRTIVSTSALPQQVDGRALTPAEIDAAVRERLAAGEDLYHLDRGALAALDADLVITQDLCAVCAVDVKEVTDALDYLGCSAQVLTTDPHTIQEVLDSIVAIGEAAGHRAQAASLVAGLEQRLGRMPGVQFPPLVPSDPRTGRPTGAPPAGPDARIQPSVIRPAVGLPAVGLPAVGLPAVGLPAVGLPAVGLPAVVLLEWTDPPFAPGHWVPEMVTLAGGDCVLGAAGERSVPTTWEAVAAAQPDVVVVAPCGFHLDGSTALAHSMVQDGPFAELLADWGDAAPQVWAVDANASFARPGPRIVDGVEALAAILAGREPDGAMACRIR